MEDSEPSSSGRSKRQRSDRNGRFAALEKFKQLKGHKNKYEVSELENVYDEVDEKVYSKTVMERQNDDWIVDDTGSGYVEDGREIFDDDLDDDSIQEARTSLGGPRKKRKLEPKAKGNIKNMFMNMASKKKAEEKMEDDDILGDLMSELQKNKSTPTRKVPAVRNKFCVTPKAPIPEKAEPDSSSKPGDAFDPDESIFEVQKEVEPVIKKRKASPVSEVRKKIAAPVAEAKKTILPTKSTEKDVDDKSVMEFEEVQPPSDVDMKEDLDLEAFDFDDFAAAAAAAPSGATKSTEAKKPTAAKPAEAKPSEAKPAEAKSSEAKPAEPKQPEQTVKFSGQQLKNVILDEAEVDFGDQVWADDFGTQIAEQPKVAKTPSGNSDTIPLVANSAGEQVFRFFWWDAYEDQYKQPGFVHMFGKVYIEASKSYTSCCLQIRNIPRRLYLLPREHFKASDNSEEKPREVEMQDVYNEFNAWAASKRISEFRSSQVKKKYAFDRDGTPLESDYMEVRYPARFPAMAETYSGPAIEHVFGTSVTSLELLLIERNIKGPGWLEVKNPQPASAPASWCGLQVNCLKPENISVHVPDEKSPKLPIAPMVIATLNVRIALNSKDQQNEVAMIGILIQEKYQIDKAAPKPMFQQHYCLVTRPRNVTWPLRSHNISSRTKVIRCETEVDLLQKFLDMIHKADPDLLVGYDCGYQLDVLMHRISMLKLPSWSRVGKLRRSTIPIYRGKLVFGQTFCGRPICDIQVSAKELNLKVRQYDLQSLCMAILKKKENECREIKPVDCPNFYASAKEIENLVQVTMNEASYIMTLFFELNVLPLAVQITCLAGNILSRTLSAGRAERNEYLLLHAFHKKDYITPDKRYATKAVQQTSRRKKAAYSGGLVLEPKKGFYDKLILLMDFNSLYPSIIQEYNLCFTTVPGAAFADTDDLVVPESGLEPGVVPTEIRKLVESRGEVKKLMKAPNLSPELKMQYNIRQMALKLTANSMYGCLGASHCRFYAKGLAALVTAKGREILQNTKSLAEKLNYEVIYGDTDSIMINTNIENYDEAFAIAKKIKQEVNKLYKRVELDIDGVFKYLLLLQKKKYAAVLISKTPSGQFELVTEHKGLDIVRRDWCPIACETGKNILDQLLTDQSSDDRLEKIFEILQSVSAKLRDGQMPLSLLVITKQLSRNPNLYPDKKLPHVAIALRLNEEGGRTWKAGDTVPYIICTDGTSRNATERAYHVDEFKKRKDLIIDVNYYLLSQIFPVILRICEPIEGIDDALLAKYLGLEDIYKTKRAIHAQEITKVAPQLNDDRFKYCEPLKFKCRNSACTSEIELNKFLATFPAGELPALAQCPNPNCDMPPYKYAKDIQNELQLAVRKFITRYYTNIMECEDPICSYKTNYVPMNFGGAYPVCRMCNEGCMHREYSEHQLYTQFVFYLNLFDLNGAKIKGHKGALATHPSEMIAAYDTLKEFVEKQISRNAYSFVNLTSVFTRNPAPEPENIIEEDDDENNDSEASAD